MRGGCDHTAGSGTCRVPAPTRVPAHRCSISFFANRPWAERGTHIVEGARPDDSLLPGRLRPGQQRAPLRLRHLCARKAGGRRGVAWDTGPPHSHAAAPAQLQQPVACRHGSLGQQTATGTRPVRAFLGMPAVVMRLFLASLASSFAGLIWVAACACASTMGGV